MELHKICRICLKSDLLVSIYSPAFLLRPIEMIEKLNICKIDDNLPTYLCQSCLYRLLDAYNLQELANASERQLRQYLGNTELGTSTSIIQNLMQAETLSIKKTLTDRVNFSNICDMFQTNDISGHQIEEDVPDDMLNDVEIDVSSLTRSEDTLSEVFVDAQINCHYENETSAFISGAMDFQNVVKPSTVICQEVSERPIPPNPKGNINKAAEKCLECGKTFSTSSYLVLHKRIHTGEKPFKCQLCPRRFTQISNLRLHERVHSGERPFQCEICARFFSTSSNLKAHSATHKETRDYQCDHCDKRFKSTRELRRHEPLHSAYKENNCSLCKKAFSKRSYLSAHMQAVHRNIRKHKCKDCCKIFASKSNLKCHMRIHSGEKPFQCKHCEWKFNQSSALIRHIRKKHFNSDSGAKSDPITDRGLYEEEKRNTRTNKIDFEFQIPIVSGTTFESNQTNTPCNSRLEHLNPTFNESITSNSYEYNKIGSSLYATPS